MGVNKIIFNDNKCIEVDDWYINLVEQARIIDPEYQLPHLKNAERKASDIKEIQRANVDLIKKIQGYDSITSLYVKVLNFFAKHNNRIDSAIYIAQQKDQEMLKDIKTYLESSIENLSKLPNDRKRVIGNITDADTVKSYKEFLTLIE